MSTGLAVPVTVDEQGTAKIAKGSELVRQLLITALRDNESRNPFQNLGISERVVYEINDEVSEAAVGQQIKAAFAVFEAEEIARLVTLTFSDGDEEGELNALIRFIDLESTRADDISISVPSDITG